MFAQSTGGAWDDVLKIYNFQFLQDLGSGSYGSVCLARNLGNEELVAVKRFLNIYKSPNTWVRIMREVELITALDNIYIVSPKGIILDGESTDLYIIMDYIQFDLNKLSKMFVFLDPFQIKVIMYRILCGVEYMHSCQIVHRDLKPSNILISPEFNVKICDFSLSRSIVGLNASEFDFSIWLRQNSNINLTTNYIANELINFHSPSFFDFAKLMKFSAINLNVKGEGALIKELVGETEENNRIEEQKSSGLIGIPIIPVEEEIFEGEDLEEGKTGASHMALQESTSLFAFNMLKSKVSNKEVDKKMEEDKWIINKKKLKRLTLQKEVMRSEENRELSQHVTTRSYRAPEIILIEKIYTTASDIWSVGCIFAELLNMMAENQPNPLLRKPFFPGRSCYPLSPDPNPHNHLNGIPAAKDDQFKTIIDILGTPNQEDISYVVDEQASQYVSSFPFQKQKDFHSLFPAADHLAISLLKHTFIYNPYLRITAKEALRHPYFAEVREKRLEMVGEKLKLKIDSVDHATNMPDFTNSILKSLQP